MNRVTRIEILIACAIACFLAFCLASSARCDDISDAKARLRAIERQKAPAETPIAESLDPVPDPAFQRAQPEIEFSQAMHSQQVETYFAVFFAQNCGGCLRMKDEGVIEALENAGHRVTVCDISTDPQPTVMAAPEVWLCDSNRKPLRKWKGYQTSKTLLTPTITEGLCKLSSNGSKWSGVSIGDGLILTVAHHKQTEEFFVDFPLQFGGTEYVRLPAELVKSDEDADLSVLRFRTPDLIDVKDYDISELPASAIEIPGYLGGDTPKRVKVRKKNIATRVAGILIDSYDGMGISSPQFGMSGSPLLTPQQQIAGIQAIGAGSEIGAVTVDTIRTFLQDVDREDSDIVASVANATATPETFAAVLAAHLAETSGQKEADEIVDGLEPTYGSLFDLTIDAPDTWRLMAAKLLTAQRISFETAGITLDWTGPKRTFVVASDGLQISPPVKVTLNKWMIRYSCSLDGVSYTPDLTRMTMLLSGAPDLTIHLR
jgi:hypothetical protein